MKKVALGLVALAIAVIAPSAMATSIVGQAAIAGADKYSATGITFTNPAVVFLADGALSPLLLEPITINNFNFTSPQSTVLFDLSGFEFTISTVAVSLNNHNFLNLSGTGTLTDAGFDPTPYMFNLSSNRTADDFYSYGLTLAPTSAVPEPASLLLLGSGLMGFAGLMLRKAKRRPSASALPS